MEDQVQDKEVQQTDRRILLVTCVAMIVLMYGVIGGYTIFYSQQQYNTAQRLISEGRWAEAVEILDEIPNYRDAKSLRSASIEAMKYEGKQSSKEY